MTDSRSVAKIAIAVAVVGIVLVAVAGVLIYERPSIVAVENRFGNVNESSTAIETDLVVHNPNPVGVTFEDMTTNYAIELNGIVMAQGTDRGIPLRKGNTTIEQTTLLDNSDIPEWWETHIRNGERTNVDITAQVDTSILGREFTFTRERTVETDITGRLNTTETRAVDPIDANIPLVSEPLLYVNETSASWGEVTENRTALDISTEVYNPSAIPYPISEFEYTVRMNNVTVGTGTTDRAYVVQSGAERTINETVMIDNSALDEWWVTHVRNDQTTTVQVDVTAVVELPNGETIRVPLGPLSTGTTFETDLFGTKNATGASAGAIERPAARSPEHRSRGRAPVES